MGGQVQITWEELSETLKVAINQVMLSSSEYSKIFKKFSFYL